MTLMDFEAADIIGRRFAFNFSLFSCSIFAICAGASPNWYALGAFTSLAAFGSGGNLVLDTTIFLEYLPGNKQWVLTVSPPSPSTLWRRSLLTVSVSRTWRAGGDWPQLLQGRSPGPSFQSADITVRHMTRVHMTTTW